MPDFKLTDTFKGYASRRDLTSLPDGFLIPPSQNVLLGDDGLPKVREGYTLYGSANATLFPIRSNYDWVTSTAVEGNLRQYNDQLEVYFSAAWRKINRDDVAAWSTTATLRFAEFWNTTEKFDDLLIVDGTSNIHAWSGGMTTYASATVNTITKEGSATWAATRFWSSGTRYVWVLDDGGTWRQAQYTGGEGTTTLTGLTVDLTAFTISAGNPIIQGIRTSAFSTFTKPSAFASTDTKDLIGVLNNQLFLGSTTSRAYFMSKQNDFTNYTASTPRIPGDGDSFTADAALIGFIPQEEFMYVSAGKDWWYQVGFQKSVAGSTATQYESSFIKPFFVPNLAAKSQEMIAKLGNDAIIFVSNEPSITSLGRVVNINTPQFSNISDPIKSDFDDYTFTNAHLKYHNRLVYLALPASSKFLIYNTQPLYNSKNEIVAQTFWEAPQILPVRRIAIISGLPYIHSNSVPETYKLFDGNNDNTNPIDAKAYFSYQNFGDDLAWKQFTEFATVGYISSNTTLTLVLIYEFGGSKSIQNYPIKGTDTKILFQSIADGSLGKSPLGNSPIGSITDTIDDLGKFRQIDTSVSINFHEMEVGYETNDVDFQWKILQFGPRLSLSPARDIQIKK